MQIAAGHLSSADLSAVVLGSSICKVFGMSLMAGLASALDTLCGQVMLPRPRTRPHMHPRFSTGQAISSIHPACVLRL